MSNAPNQKAPKDIRSEICSVLLVSLLFLEGTSVKQVHLTCFQHMALVNDCPVYISGVCQASVSSTVWQAWNFWSHKCSVLHVFVKKADVIFRSNVWSEQLYIVMLAVAHTLNNVFCKYWDRSLVCLYMSLWWQEERWTLISKDVVNLLTLCDLGSSLPGMRAFSEAELFWKFCLFILKVLIVPSF